VLAAVGASAESPNGASASGDDTGNPVAQVRQQRSWEYGPFVNWGMGLGDRSDYKFLSGGVEFGKVLSPVVHAGFLSGQFQFATNIMPLWQAYTPPPHNEAYTCVTPGGQLVSCVLPTGGGTFYGVSLTPVIFRWNFLTHSRRIQPWFQGAGGLIYTTHKFPPNILTNKALGINGGTSVWNFSPQGGGGIHYFIRPKRSIDLGVNGVHISGRERQHSDSGGIHVLEMMKTGNKPPQRTKIVRRGPRQGTRAQGTREQGTRGPGNVGPGIKD
jgi:lipid A 3-O-deacylase